MPSANNILEIRALAHPSESEGCARMMADTDPWLTLGRTYDACLQVVGDQSKEVYVARLGGGGRGFPHHRIAGKGSVAVSSGGPMGGVPEGVSRDGG